MQFCPHDGTLLMVNVMFPSTPAQELRFICPVCPYVHLPRRVMTTLVPTTKKRIDDVIGGAQAWANVDKTEAQCPACGCNEAYFKQMQLRSADEPMTTFYRCVKCHNRWTD